MIKMENRLKCSGCTACMAVCPKQCIKMEEDDEGFLYPAINYGVCVNCGVCEKVCPVENKRTVNDETKKVLAYAVVSKDLYVRVHSSSGGLFSVIANSVLDKGGIVVGASFVNDLKVHHIIIEDREKLEKLRGSKYVQSNLDNVFISIREQLDTGKTVLFTGTSCQISGLKAFLGKEYVNLYLVDVLCHGVPSPKVWRKHLEYMEKQYDSKVVSVEFRNKKYGWKKICLRYFFDNGENIVISANDDPYMKMFLGNIALRPSCYECCFKSVYRNSDLTIGDFWGIENVKPEFDDDLGTSIVLVQSEKGAELLNSIRHSLQLAEVSVKQALPSTMDSMHSVSIPKKRRKFFEKIDGDYCDLIQFTIPTLKDRVYWKMRGIFGK